MQVNGVTNILASKHVFHPHGHSSAMARISPGGGGGSQGEVRATVRTLETPWLLECGAPSGRSTVSGRGTARREARPEDVHCSGIFQLRNVYKIRLCFSSDIKPKKRNARNESEWIGKRQPKQARRSRLRATRTEHRCRDDVRRGDAPPAGSASFLSISDGVERLTVTNILLRGAPVRSMACNSHDRHPTP